MRTVPLLLMPGLLLGGCLPGGKPDFPATVKAPPRIPRPNLADAAVSGEPAVEQYTYADLADPQAWEASDAARLLDIQTAVERARKLGVLKPLHPAERFDPDQPVTYAVFRRWANGYLDRTVAKPVYSLEMEKELAGGTSETEIVVGGSTRRLPAELTVGQHTVMPQQALTRERFAVVYASLKGESPKRDPDGEPTPQPGAKDAKTLESFKDYLEIDLWTRPYVAGLMDDKIPATVFGVVENFEPGRPVTRGEAILILDRLFPDPVAEKPERATINVPEAH